MSFLAVIAAASVLGATAPCAVGNEIPASLVFAEGGDDVGLQEAAERLRRGRIAEAKVVLMRGTSELKPPRAHAASLLALAHAADGEPRAASEWARRALEERSSSPDIAAQVSLNAAFALAESGDASGARAALHAARSAAQASGNHAIDAAAAVNLALLEARIDASALGAARSALEAAKRVEPPARRASLLAATGLALVPTRAVRPGSAEMLATEILAEAYRAATEARDSRLMAHALGLIGELHLRTGNAAVARTSLERANALSRAADEDPWRFRWMWLLGLAQRELGEPGALASLDEAVTLLEAEKARRSFAAFASLTLSRDYVRAYRDLTDLLLREAMRREGGEQEKLLARALKVLELSQSAEIEDFFRDPCIVRRSAEPPPALPPHAAFVYPVVLDDRTEILVVHASGLRRFSSPHGSAEIGRDVRRLRAALEPPGSSGYAAPARRLHTALVQPIESFLSARSVKTIVWIPDAALRGLPFAALHDGRAHLVEKYALAVTPLAAHGDSARAPARMRAALTGLSLPRGGFPALPAVARELEELSAILSAPVLRDEAFTASALRGTLEKTPVNVIHIASHGQFAPEQGETFLLTYDGRLTLPQLRGALTAGQLREEPIDLLTLSACQTAAGDERSALGLAGAAIGAGARSVLATLWSVADESTARMVTTFYKGLIAPGGSKAAALREAQLALMKDERFAHPAYWSPYLLIGNWN